jgi:SAM-dependent methyltransferase
MIRSEGDFIIEGFLECTNDNCQETFPIVEGVPIVLRDFAAWWRTEKAGFYHIKRRSAEMDAYFESLEENDHRYFRDKSRLNSYIDFHYSIPPDSPDFMTQQADPRTYWDIVTKAGRPGDGSHYKRSLDLGCSVGRYTFTLARFSESSVGMDLNFSAVAYAAGLQRNIHQSFERKMHGRCFKAAEVSFEFPRNVFSLSPTLLIRLSVPGNLILSPV